MKHFKEFKVNEKKVVPFEIQDSVGIEVKAAEKAIQSAWTSGLTYKGMEFWDNIYMDSIMGLAAEIVGMGETIEIDVWNDERDEYDDETEMITIDGQESYLGYLPNEDVFVSGWDMDEDSTFSNVAYITIDDKGKAHEAKMKKTVDGYAGFYNGAYKELKKLHRNIIDIRLD